MKKSVLFVLCLIFAFPICTFNADAMGTSAQAHILIDADTGLVLSSNNETQKLKMASTTKIMTTLLTLEEAEKKDRTVTFSDKMSAEGSSMNLEVGDKLKLSDLAAGMMMASGNDAANAAAVSISGSLESFAKLMNNKAETIGMKNTNFVTPSGLDDEEHYSTAYDMALLMSEAIKNKNFAELSASGKKAVSFVYPEEKVITYSNHNRLLSLYEYCTGGKTGYTEAAGRCLVSTAEKDGVTLIAVTLNAPDDWNDHKSLYEYGFSLYTKVDFDESNREFSLKLSGGTQDYFIAKAENVSLTVPAKRINDIEKNIYLPNFLFAPVKAGETVGKITYVLDGNEIAKAEIKVLKTVDEKPPMSFFERLLSIFKKD